MEMIYFAAAIMLGMAAVGAAIGISLLGASSWKVLLVSLT